MTLKVQTAIEKKIFNFCDSNDIIKKFKRQSTIQDKIFTNYMSGKKPVSTTY